ncbi:MAG: methanogen output domain 1-containing protein [Methanobacterium sp.]|nr:methanogen output domain 1-containing protein [Methanobacterium sp.]
MSNPKVLIIEDDAITALELKTKLELWGYDVPAVASYGKEAIDMVENIDIDLILADIVIKGDMDGIDAVDKISEFTDAPVLYITAHADDATFKRAKRTKPYGYVFKPFNDQELKFNIEIALNKSGSQFDIKDLKDQKERLKVINNFILSSTPALTSSVHIEDTAAFLTAFARMFEDNVKPYMEEEVDLNEEDPEELFYNYLNWISLFFKNLGYKSEVGEDEFKISHCIWGNSTMENKIFCLMCHAMADLTFKWINIAGWMEQEIKVGVNPSVCHFRYWFTE